MPPGAIGFLTQRDRAWVVRAVHALRRPADRKPLRLRLRAIHARVLAAVREVLGAVDEKRQAYDQVKTIAQRAKPKSAAMAATAPAARACGRKSCASKRSPRRATNRGALTRRARAPPAERVAASSPRRALLGTELAER